MNYIQLISILLELVIAVLFLIVALRGKKYFYGLFITFVIYVFYDLSRLFLWDIEEGLLTGIFLIATLGAFYSVWNIYKESKLVRSRK